MDPNNVKGLFRRGKALIHLNDLELAKTDLEKALELSGNSDKAIARELQLLQKQQQIQDQKDKRMYAAMFS